MGMTRRSCAWSPAPTWPAVFMRVTLRAFWPRCALRWRRQGVTIGAHVAYPDLVGFGRRNMDVTSAELQADVMYQIGAELQGWPRPLARGCATSSRTARSTTPSPTTSARPKPSSPPRAVDPTLVLVALAGAPLVQWARDAGLTVVGEAFADRAYTPEGTLVSRREKGPCCTMPSWSPSACCAWCVNGGGGHRRQPGAHRCPVHLRARRQRRCGGDGARRAPPWSKTAWCCAPL